MHDRLIMATKLPNLLTYFRLFAVILVVGFLYLDPPTGNWLALAAYTLACITDFLDGYLARTLNQQSALGRFLDPIADKILVAAVLMVVTANGTVADWNVLPAIVMLSREIMVSGLREFLAELHVGLPVSTLAKWKTTLQMVALGFLIVGAAGPDFGPLSTTEVGIVGLWIAAVLTMVTGYDYLRAGLRHINDSA